MTECRRVTLSFDLPLEVIEQSSDLKGATQGVTVESVAADLCRRHDPRNGYIHFTVDTGGSERRSEERYE